MTYFRTERLLNIINIITAQHLAKIEQDIDAMLVDADESQSKIADMERELVTLERELVTLKKDMNQILHRSRNVERVASRAKRQY